jgi:hypothetical protein
MAMDKKFFEFWRHTFANAAKGMQQFETLSQWMDQGMKGVQEISDRFRKAYDLDRVPAASEEGKRLWARATQDFHASYQAFLDGMGLVPKEKYTALSKKCEALESVIAEQEVELARLRRRLEVEKTGENLKGFVQLMENQALQFQKAMDAMGMFMGSDKNKSKE